MDPDERGLLAVALTAVLIPSSQRRGGRDLKKYCRRHPCDRSGRGGSMKGAVKRNTSAPTGCLDKERIVTASPASVETVCGSGFQTDSIVRHNVASSSETEKRHGGDNLPTTVLFEPQRAIAFPGRARGDRVKIGSSAVAVDQSPRGSSPSTLSVPSTPTTSGRNHRAAGKPFGTAMSSSSVS